MNFNEFVKFFHKKGNLLGSDLFYFILKKRLLINK